jgi:hypothetical protein
MKAFLCCFEALVYPKRPTNRSRVILAGGLDANALMKASSAEASMLARMASTDATGLGAAWLGDG